MIRIGADMRVLARDRIVGEPVGDARELGLAIAIVAAEPRVDMVVAVGLVEPGRQHVVHAQPPRDRIDIEVERGGREQQAIARRPVRRHLVEDRRVPPARYPPARTPSRVREPLTPTRTRGHTPPPLDPTTLAPVSPTPT